MFHPLPTPAVLLHERQGGREDALAPLPRLDGPRDEGLAVADPLDVVQDGDLRVARQDKVTVHAVDREVGRDGRLRRREALRDGRPAVDASRPRRVPQRSRVCKDVRPNVDEREELEDVFDRGVVREGLGWFD